MSTVAERIAADLNSPAAIPRRNGEPVFNEPWESRAFGIAVAICERGLFTWDEFRDQLIAEIPHQTRAVRTPAITSAFSALSKISLSRREPARRLKSKVRW
jgi:hypothetical protein